MRKKFLSGLMVTALTLSLLGGTALASVNPALTTSGATTSITGDSNVLAEGDIYSVILPTSLSFALNPKNYKTASGYELGQVISGRYAIVNRSNIAVQVDVECVVDVSGTAAEVTTEAVVKKSNDDRATDNRYMYLALTPIQDKLDTSLVTADNVSGSMFFLNGLTNVFAENTLATPSSVALSVSDAAVSASSLSFALKEDKYTEYVSGNTVGELEIESDTPGGIVSSDAVGFTFTGVLSEYADGWDKVDDEDIVIGLKFSIDKIPEYDDITTVDGAYGLISEGIELPTTTTTCIKTWASAINGYYLDKTGTSGFGSTPDLVMISLNGKPATLLTLTTDYTLVGTRVALPYKTAWDSTSVTTVTAYVKVGTTYYKVSLK